MNNDIIAIDADSFAYRLGPQCVTDNFYSDFLPTESDKLWIGQEDSNTIIEDLGDGNMVESSLSLAKEAIGKQIDIICEELSTDNYKLFITASNSVSKLFNRFKHKKPIENFRYGIARKYLDHGYKHNRTGALPGGLSAIMKSMVKDYDAHIVEGAEADDLVCALARERRWKIAAIDKDILNQVPGTHFNYMSETMITTTEEWAKHYKFLQAITGDPGDGYKGVPNVGIKGAEKFISIGMSEEELARGTWQAYKSKNMSFDEFISTVRLADMHQLNFINDSMEWYLDLWEPSLELVLNHGD